MYLDKLNWRYATKKMDPTKSVPQDKVDRIVEAVRLAPTSSGLQPFELIVVTNKALKDKIKEAAYGQAQVSDGSHLLVFAAWGTYTPERINQMFDQVIEERGVNDDAWEAYRQRLLGMFGPRDAEENYAHAARQAYIALGMALSAAAFEEVDSTPMEGFDPEAVDEILGLKERGLRSVLLLPLGYRDETADWLVNLKKVRRAKENFVIEMA